MEEFFYLILIIIWLLVSYFQRQKKAREKAASRPGTQQEPAPARPQEVDLEDLLEDFLGGKKKQQPIPGPEPQMQEEAVLDSDEGRNYESWESQAQKDYDRSERGSGEYGQAAALEEYKGTSGVDDDFEFSTEGKVETIEDVIRSHAAQDAREQALAEEKYEGQAHKEIPEFDLRTAVIFSEILNKKYH